MPFRDQIFPFFFESDQIRMIRDRIEMREEQRDRLRAEWHKYRELSLADLKDSLRSELSRRDLIHRRAQAYLGTVAVMSAFTIGTIRSFPSSGSIIGIPLAIASIATVLFLSGAAWAALRIARPAPIFDLTLQARMSGVTPLEEGELKDALIRMIHMNQAHNLIFSTYSERASRALRNGLATLIAALLLLLVVRLW